MNKNIKYFLKSIFNTNGIYRLLFTIIKDNILKIVQKFSSLVYFDIVMKQMLAAL